MKKSIYWLACLLLLSFVSANAMAVSKITSMKIEKRKLKVNEKVKITIYGVLPAGKKCRMIYTRGDGTPKSLFGVAKKFPFVLTPYYAPSYKKPGTYTITVWGDTTLPNNGCLGKVSVKVTVASKIKMGKVTKLFSSPCPKGWKLKARYASGAYTCVPKPPRTPLKCPPKTQYFKTDCAIGCKPVPY